MLLLGVVGLERAPRVARGVANSAGEVLLATLYIGTRFRTGRIITVGSCSQMNVETCAALQEPTASQNWRVRGQHYILSEKEQTYGYYDNERFALPFAT